MDPKIMKESVKSPTDKVKTQQSIKLAFRGVIASLMITILGLFIGLSWQISDLNRSIVAIDQKLTQDLTD